MPSRVPVAIALGADAIREALEPGDGLTTVGFASGVCVPACALPPLSVGPADEGPGGDESLVAVVDTGGCGSVGGVAVEMDALVSASEAGALIGTRSIAPPARITRLDRPFLTKGLTANTTVVLAESTVPETRWVQSYVGRDAQVPFSSPLKAPVARQAMGG